MNIETNIQNELLDKVLKDTGKHFEVCEKQFIYSIDDMWSDCKSTKLLLEYIKSMRLKLVFECSNLNCVDDSVYLKNIYHIKGKISAIDDILFILEKHINNE